jgi:Ca2+-binding RTX toxin-like protein
MAARAIVTRLAAGLGVATLAAAFWCGVSVNGADAATAAPREGDERGTRSQGAVQARPIGHAAARRGAGQANRARAPMGRGAGRPAQTTAAAPVAPAGDVVPPISPQVFSAVIRAAGPERSDRVLLLALAWRESRFDPTARNTASSARGLMQFTRSAWLEAVRDHGAAHGLASSASAIAGAETLDASGYSIVWTEGFDSSVVRVSRVWGDVKIGNSEATLTSTAAGGWQSAGLMVPPTGRDAGDGYGLYTMTARIDDSEGPGAFACLWPGTDVWPGPELDLFEKASAANNSGYSTVHWKGTNGSDQYQVYFFPGDIDLSQTHSYAMDWAADHISLYIDGRLIYATNAHVPADFAHGGQDLAFGAGMQPGWAASQQNKDGTNVLHVYDMSYAAPSEPPPLPTLGISDASVTEGGSLIFTVSLSAASDAPVTVAYGTANGSATAGSDYTAGTGTLTFAAGETSRTVTVQTTDDSSDEPDETLVLHLTSPAGATLADAEGTGTIIDNDPAPNIVTGTSGNNVLTGSAGTDIITGGRGNDTMTGLGGEDDFVFSRKDGFDWITDFTPGVDDLVFHGISASQLKARAATYSGVSGTDVIYGGNDHVFLESVAPASFSMRDDIILA